MSMPSNKSSMLRTLFLALAAAATAQAMMPSSVATSLPPTRSCPASQVRAVSEAGGSAVFSCTFADLDPLEVEARVSETFSWAGASWQVVFFPSGHKGEADFASCYLRLAADSRAPLPLPRGLSFALTARAARAAGEPASKKPGSHGKRVLASRASEGHTFALYPARAQSWGFAKFLPKRTLFGTAGASGASDGGGNQGVEVEVALGPALAVIEDGPPIGLVNHGNTCYLNAFLQSLFHVDAFREGLLALDPKGGQGRGQNRAAAELAHVFRSLKGGRASGGGGGGALLGGGLGGGRPQAAVRTLGLCRGLGINVQSQEDSQEFKGILFGSLMESLAAEGLDGSALEAPFRGELRNEIECLDVAFRKRWAEPFSELALDVASGGRGKQTVEAALSRYFADEEMSGANGYRARGFEGKQRAAKRVALAQPPEVPKKGRRGQYKPPASACARPRLIVAPAARPFLWPSLSLSLSLSARAEVLHLQLKRFAYRPSAGGQYGLVKLGDKLAFDQELDLKPYLAQQDEDDEERDLGGGGGGWAGGPQSSSPARRASSRYVLHAVLIHTGSASYGHYYAYVRPNLGQGSAPAGGKDGGGWVRCDDTRVEAVPWKQVREEGGGFGSASRDMQQAGLSTNAYLLQYVREDCLPAILHHGENPVRAVPVEAAPAQAAPAA